MKQITLEELENIINNGLEKTFSFLPQLQVALHTIDRAILRQMERHYYKGEVDSELIKNRAILHGMIKNNSSTAYINALKEVNNAKKNNNDKEALKGEKIIIDFGERFDFED